MGPPLISGGNEAIEMIEAAGYYSFNGAAADQRRKLHFAGRNANRETKLQWGRR